MLNLAASTDPGWARRALADPAELLLDHAHCEKKAAGVAVRLLFQYPQHGFLLAPLSRIAREELGHFEQVLTLLAARDIAFRRQRPSPYAGRLKALVRAPEPERLIDLLLCCALIEARSCERMQRLAEATEDGELASFYRGLHAAEARHHGIYLDLARRLAAADEVALRLAELAEREAAILAEPSTLCRMHT
jgi:tRNA-(ms[2]io[6]A)-hydroxylase